MKMQFLGCLALIIAATGVIGCQKSSDDDTVSQTGQQQTEHEAETDSTANTSAPHAAGEQAASSTNAVDVFPTGRTSAEGTACDLARAFIHADSELLRAACLQQAPGESGFAYETFLAGVVTEMNSLGSRPASEFGGPREITRVFKARPLTAQGAASYGYATMNLSDVRFVDVETRLWSGSIYINRTLVLQNSEGNWYAMPRPDLFPLLSVGLNSESVSTEEWSAQ